MNQPVTLPLWALVLLVAFAAITAASHLLFPSVRWFLRRRMERVVTRLNARLARPIEPFQLHRRSDMIQRLAYDPEVLRAVLDHARERGVPEDVAFQRARTYAREIVPAFSATLYFTVGARLARFLSRAFYDIRLEGDLIALLRGMPQDATVIFVMNHRSNMDYVLVTWLLARASSLSYAVGEWARVWPMAPLVRWLGGYFVRRQSHGALYRKVLARWVQMVTRGGVTQAVFPEGGLSRDGALRAPRLGLLSYIAAPDPLRERPVVFVPVAINYDRALEDEILLGAAEGNGFRVPWGKIVGASIHQFWQRLTRRFRGFGTATVAFGEPLALADWTGDVAGLGEELMARIGAAVPVLPVPLVAQVVLAGEAGVVRGVERRLRDLAATGANLPRETPVQIAGRALDLLRTRGLVDAQARPLPGAEPLLRFYANSIAHLTTPPT